VKIITLPPERPTFTLLPMQNESRKPVGPACANPAGPSGFLSLD